MAVMAPSMVALPMCAPVALPSLNETPCPSRKGLLPPLNCALNVIGVPTVAVAGAAVNVRLPGGGCGASLTCSVTGEELLPAWVVDPLYAACSDRDPGVA